MNIRKVTRNYKRLKSEKRDIQIKFRINKKLFEFVDYDNGITIGKKFQLVEGQENKAARY